ncbi:MAG: glycosyltransferase family 2 protein [Candidatus Hydrogenedentes bacterium]|nr:glycosyltransferase family 2 protein [Candidatus Hydrogenedentota bacterium]
MSELSLTVVVPTWNKVGLLAACLHSLELQSCPPDAIIVVDDRSTEDVQGRIAAAFPRVRVIRLEVNSGFCRAVNTGMRATSGSHVLLLNNDMTLERDCIERLMYAAERSPATLLTPLVLFESQRDVIYSAGDRVRVDGRPESIGHRVSRDVFTLPSRIFGVTGGAALIPREVFDHIGLFDERFIAYFEDADFCMRARLAGFDAALVPDAIAYHVGSASLGGKTWWRSRQCFRNHALLVAKNFPRQVLLRNGAAILRECFHQARMLVSSARSEFGMLRALGIMAGTIGDMLALVPHAARERARIQRTRLISPERVAELLSQTGGDA